MRRHRRRLARRNPTTSTVAAGALIAAGIAATAYGFVPHTRAVGDSSLLGKDFGYIVGGRILGPMAIGGGIGLLVRPSWVGWVLGATIGTFAGAIATKLDRADYASNTSTGTGALPPSRPSCLECTEKHLGAAAVLIGEVGDGYTAHRMLAVGHLNEAADESQAFPALHVAIRESRKNYQTNGVVPDFQALSRLLYAADPSQGVPASAA